MIGGGDWSKNRLFRCHSIFNKQIINTLKKSKFYKALAVCLDPLRGYIILAEKLYSESDNFKQDNKFARAFNLVHLMI